MYWEPYQTTISNKQLLSNGVSWENSQRLLDPCATVHRPEKIPYSWVLDVVTGVSSTVISAKILLYFGLNYVIKCSFDRNCDNFEKCI